ncbi:MAG: DUF1015 domain-containing protein [Fimbriimonadaceae bacterium]|nr:DUF1015 domain-containing protein [Fimbriimonadaceae bacterium]
MAVIRPFHGLRYCDPASLPNRVAPPYDVLSSEERNALAARDAHNVVHLTLPEAKSDDRSKYVKYARSAAALSEWRREGVVAPDAKETFYRYIQTFSIPGVSHPVTRTALIALIKTEPYEKGVVLPHEQTFPKHKEDRLRLLEATRAHLECIFGLFEDPNRAIFDAIAGAQGSPGSALVTEDGVEHRLERIEDPEATQDLAARLAPSKVWIADGHHRYETACTFRAELGEREGLVPEDFMMMALSSMSDPGLALLPTHRVLQKLPVPAGHLDDVLQRRFNVRKVANSQLMETITRLRSDEARAFGIALPGGQGLVATMEEPRDAIEWVEGEASDLLKMLDVTILHSVIFEQLLGVRGLDGIGYTRDADEALSAVEEGAGAAFLMNPPSVDDMRLIALGGEKMPQKSTFYYPKILSGLVMWSLNDF